MKRPAFKLIVILIIVAAFSIASAQNDNLLENPGFETFREVEEGQAVAIGWQPWNVPLDANSPTFERQPGYVAATTDQTPRILSGDDAQAIFTDFYYTFNGGIFQRVTGIDPDTDLTFSVEAWIWSSNLDDRANSGDSAAVTVAVGIDPEGGTDGTSANIVWSDESATTYDEFGEYTITTTTTGEAATVFVRINVDEALRNTFVFLDEASLIGGNADTSGIEEPMAVTEVTDEAPMVGEETDEPVATEAPPTDPPAPTATETEVPTNTAIPASDTPMPTNTEMPTDTPVPTQTEIPTREPVPTEQDLGIIVPTDTPAQEQAQPTDPPPPTATAIPTVTPVPTNTLPPTSTPVPPPTNTPIESVIETVEEDTNTPVPTATAAIEVEAEETEEIVSDAQAAPTVDPFPGVIVHTVERGDTVARIAVLYGSTTERIIEQNDLGSNALIFVGQGLEIPVRVVAATDTPTPTPVVIVVTATPGAANPPPGGVYIVQPGDTLSGIARQFNTSLGELAQINSIPNPNSITVGQQIIIPGADGGVEPPIEPTPVTPEPVATYTVQPGDNLYRVAVRFGITVQELIEFNNISTPNVIYVGQVLQIP